MGQLDPLYVRGTLPNMGPPTTFWGGCRGGIERGGHWMDGQGPDPSICPEGTEGAFSGYPLFAGPSRNALGGSGGIEWVGGSKPLICLVTPPNIGICDAYLGEDAMERWNQ